jgi:hypothetical protein
LRSRTLVVAMLELTEVGVRAMLATTLWGAVAMVMVVGLLGMSDISVVLLEAVFTVVMLGVEVA